MTEVEMTSHLIKLADMGITGIKIYYEGGGDSGAIEYIAVTSAPLGDDEENALDYIQENINAWSSEELVLLKNFESGIAADLESFAESKILDDIEDWWNNEGGYGSMCILVPSGKYKIFNNINIVTTESYEHEGSLIEKSVQ